MTKELRKQHGESSPSNDGRPYHREGEQTIALEGSVIIVRDASFHVVARSKNLRGIIDYSRKHLVERVDLYGPYADGRGQLGVTWADGASSISTFASFTVLQQWVKARRMFKAATVTVHKRG